MGFFLAFRLPRMVTLLCRFLTSDFHMNFQIRVVLPDLGKPRSMGLTPGAAREPGCSRRGERPASWWWLPCFVGSAYRECLENGTWASRINYSQCVPILDDKVSSPHLPRPWSLSDIRAQVKCRAAGWQHRSCASQPLLPLPHVLPCAQQPCSRAEKGDMEPQLRLVEKHNPGDT